MIPLYFDQCFAWLHPAQGGRGVVICSAQGVEELCTHRFMRHLADELAAAGLPTLRFDYQGTGNSLGTDLDAERVAQWLTSIRQAVDCLKRETGVSEVALVGLRLGALLAAEVARQLPEVLMLALLAPVTSGKSYLREMRVLGPMIAQSARVATPATVPPIDGIEVAGFHLTEQTMDSLQQIDLLALETAPAQRVLLMGRHDSAAETRLAERLHSLGSQVDRIEFPGYAELEWNTSFATLPHGVFESAVQWLAHGLPVGAVAPVPHQLSTLEGGRWKEDPVRFGSEQRLFAIRCRPDGPDSGSQQRKLVLFVNHGSNHHIGWARMHVMLSRRFAESGIASLRMDISGVGDSPAHPGYVENLLYARHSQKDVYAVLDWLQDQGYQHVTVIGHCAGAYLGFYSALRDARVKAVVMLNLQRFFWARGDSLEIASRQSFRSTDWYLTKLRDPKILHRLLTAQINLSGISLILLQRVLRRGHNAIVRIIGPVLGNEGFSRKVVRWLRELSARGTRVLLVYSAEDGGLDELASHAGANGRKIRNLPNIELRVLDGADHNLTPAWAQQQYAEILQEFLTRA